MQINRQLTYNILFFGIFLLIFCLISLPNHYLLRTYALDLGMFTHAMFDFSHGRMNTFLTGLNNPVSYFADHFSPITILLSPFQYIFGTYTPLVIQIFTVLLGGVGVYKYARLYNFAYTQARFFSFYFFILWAIINALSYDFHTNVLGAMWVIWLFYFYETKRYYSTLITGILILICKENMGLWLGFLWSGYGLLKYPGFKKYVRRFIIPSLFCLVYSYVVITLVMPTLNLDNTNTQLLRYNHWGETPSEILSNFINNPILFLEIFINLDNNGDIIAWGPKLELWFVLILSGGYILFRKPAFLWMSIPIFAQKFLSSEPSIQGINYQYSIEFAPILAVASIHFIKSIEPKKQFISLFFLVLGAAIAAIFNSSMYSGKKYTTIQMAFYNLQHYKGDIENLHEVKKAWNELPNNAIISANSNAIPHLAMREKIYHFPRVDDAEYIVLYLPSTYPLSREDFETKIEELKVSEFSVWKDIPNLLILKRN